MGRGFKLVREQAAIWISAALGLAALAAGTAWLGLAREIPGRYAGVARIELPLPTDVVVHAPASNGPFDVAKDVERMRPDLALLEYGPFGPLPKIAPDGRRPFLAYARPFDLEDKRPKIAVLLVGLGLQRKLMNAALALPAPMGLQFSPFHAGGYFWVSYLSLGGTRDAFDIEAYLHGLGPLSDSQQDVLANAVNERLDDLYLAARVPYLAPLSLPPCRCQDPLTILDSLLAADPSDDPAER